MGILDVKRARNAAEEACCTFRDEEADAPEKATADGYLQGLERGDDGEEGDFDREDEEMPDLAGYVQNPWSQ